MSTPPIGYQRGATSGRIVFMAYFGTIAEGAVFLLLTPFLLRRLGPAAYGIWTLGVTLADWLQLLDLGVREAILKFSAAHQARSERGAIRPLAETAIGVYAAIGVLALVGSAAVATWGVPFLVDDRSAWGDLRIAILLLGLSAAISFPLGVAGSLLEGLLRFDLMNLFRTAHAVLRLVLVVLALQLDLGIAGVACAELLGRLALHAMRWRALSRVYPEVVPRGGFHRGEIARLADFGLWNGLRHVVEVAVSRLFEPLLSIFAGLPAVGAFYAGRRLATMPAEAIGPLASVLFPLASELDASGRKVALQDSLLKATKFAWTISVPMALLLALGASPIQANWLGGRAPQAEGVLQVFSAVFLLVAASLPSESVLLGLGRTRLLAGCGLVQAAITVGLGIPLTAAYGAQGLAWAALVGVGLGQAAVQIPLAARACGFSVATFALRAFAPAVAIGLPVGLVMWRLRDEVALGGLAALASWAGGALATYATLGWFFVLNGEERAFVKTHAQRIFVRLDPTGSSR